MSEFVYKKSRSSFASLQNMLVTWWTILRICLEERLVYRGDFVLGTLMRFLPIVTQIFLWGTIFETISGKIAGYSYHDFIAYYLLTMVARAFSSMPGLASGIAAEIRDGSVKKYLIQPIDMVGFLLLNRLAHKLVYYGIAIGPFALIFFLCRNFFPSMPSSETMIAFAISLVLSFLLGFFLEAAIGLIGFWFLEVSSLLFIYMLFNFFFSGHMFPLDILPYPWNYVFEAMPLQYLAYFPAAVWLGKIEGESLLIALWVETAWVLFFILVCRVAFHRGVKRYSGFGG